MTTLSYELQEQHTRTTRIKNAGPTKRRHQPVPPPLSLDRDVEGARDVGDDVGSEGDGGGRGFFTFKADRRVDALPGILSAGMAPSSSPRREASNRPRVVQ